MKLRHGCSQHSFADEIHWSRTATTISAQQTGEGQVNLQKRVEEFHSDITELHKGVEKYGSIVHGNNSILKRLSGIISGYALEVCR